MQFGKTRSDIAFYIVSHGSSLSLTYKRNSYYQHYRRNICRFVSENYASEGENYNNCAKRHPYKILQE